MNRNLCRLLVLIQAVIPGVLQASGGRQDSDITVADVVVNVRKAVGYEHLQKQEGGILMEGTTKYIEGDQSFSLLFTPDGKFIRKIEGRLGRTVSFDGTNGWESDWSGPSRPLVMDDLEREQFFTWIQTGRWLAEDGPFAISMLDKQTDQQKVALTMKLKKGIMEAHLTIDRATWLPQSLQVHSASGEQSWEFQDYRSEMRFTLAHQINYSKGGTAYQIRSIAPAPSLAQNQFGPLKVKPDDTVFNHDLPAKVKVRRVRELFLVRPRINGKNLGWFVLDSGTSGMIISPEAARAAHMPSLGGKIADGGIFRQGTTFELGPMTVSNMVYGEMELRRFGLPIAGICGYDLFSRAVVVMDTAKGTVEIHDPSRYQLPAGQWHEVLLSRKVPYVLARFENQEGFFMLDTGTPLAVLFFGTAVKQRNLLHGRLVKAYPEYWASTPNYYTGPIQWFELAGHRFVNPPARFLPYKGEAFFNPSRVGVIGLGLFDDFQLIFDYSHNRIALVYKSNTQKQPSHPGGIA